MLKPLYGDAKHHDAPITPPKYPVTTLEPKPILNDGKLAVHRLRRALVELLTSVGANPDEPQDVSRRFGLDKTLTWRIARAVREEDPWESLQHLPSRAGLRIFASAMAKHGATAERVESLWRAQEEFERFIETHTRDRETLEMMVSVGARKSAHKRLETFRRNGFQANSALLGVRAASQIGLSFMAPSKEAGKLDLAVCVGLIDFCRLRPDVPWAIASRKDWGGEIGTQNGHASHEEPIDPRVTGFEAPLLHDYCTAPLPELRVVEYPPGVMRYMLSEGPVGYTAAATVFSGWIDRGSVSMYEASPGEPGDHGTNLCTPVESLSLDLFVHRDLGFALNPSVHVYSQFPGGPQYPDPGSEAAILPVPTDIVDLGLMQPETPSPDVPRYHELAANVASRLGHNLGDFHLFRYRLRYPPIPAMAVLRHPLLPAKK
ncbi:MAG: hypothetical protein KF745_07895 [Phycisphaeraceae bacterium]|nr:hypothetical protein [Phycisphaeraceae bacterium]